MEDGKRATSNAIRADILHCYADHFHECCVEIALQ
jgi:hypothetical protein